MNTGILCDVAAERAILSAIGKYSNEAYLEVADVITDTSFTVDSNSIIFRCIKNILEHNSETKVDASSIYSSAKEIGVYYHLEKPDEAKHLNAILSFPASLTNTRSYAIKIRKLEVTRLLRKLLSQGQDDLLNITGTETTSEILAIVENLVFNFSTSLDGESGNPELIGEGILDYLQHKIDNPVDQLGISTGCPVWDASIGGGLRRGTVNVIGARAKAGKSMLGNNIGFYVAGRTKIPVLNMDTEMYKEDHIDRTLASRSGIPTNDISTGKFGENPEQVAELKRIAKYLGDIKEYPYYHKSIAGKSFEDQVSIMRRWIMKDVGLRPDGTAKDCLIIYDYLKLMDTQGMSGDMKEYQLLGFMMTTLHNFAVKYGVPILAFIQLNRDGINKEDSSTISHSDRIAWLCSNFSIFKSKSQPEIANDGGQKYGNTKLIPVISRHGAGFNFGSYINYNMEGHIGKITELGTTDYIKENQKEIQIHGEIAFKGTTDGTTQSD